MVRFMGFLDKLKGLFKAPEVHLVRIILENYSNTEVRILLKGSMDENLERTVPIRRPIILYPKTYKVLTVVKEEFSEWARYVFAEVEPITQPSEGKIEVYIFKDETEEKIPLVKSLEIKDMRLYTPKTDPEKIIPRPIDII